MGEWAINYDSDHRTPANKGRPKLKILEKGQTLQIDLFPIYIGRNSECDIVIEDPRVSKKHCIIEKNVIGHWIISDLDSTNGTFVTRGEKTISNPKNTQIVKGDIISIGPSLVEFEVL